VPEPSGLSFEAPTAVHADEDEQETLFRKANCDPVGLGVDCTVHFAPFHCSASVIPVLGSVAPTVRQAEDEVHVMENSAAPGFALVGVDWMLQLAPSQRSASEPWSVSPTASQAVDDVHAIPERKLNCAPDRFGVGCTVQVVPFQRSASVTSTPALSV
jgi:hypothetical protein